MAPIEINDKEDLLMEAVLLNYSAAQVARHWKTSLTSALSDRGLMVGSLGKAERMKVSPRRDFYPHPRMKLRSPELLDYKA